MLFKGNKLLVILILMFIISPFILELSPPVKDKELMSRYSTHNPYAKGCEGIFRVCKKIGIDASTYNYSTSFLRSIDNRVMIIIDNGDGGEDKDFLDEIKQWLHSGNRAIIISKDLPEIKFNPVYFDGYQYGKYGKGLIILNDNPDFFTNKNLKRGAPMFMKMLSRAGVNENKGAIVFDEYIHGYGSNENVWDVIPLWAKLGVIEILIVFVGIIVMNARRFGRPKVMVDDEKRSIQEYYSAVNRLYKRSKDHSGMAKEYFDIFTQKVIRKYGGDARDYDTLKHLWQKRGLGEYELLVECISTISTQRDEIMKEETFKECINKIDVLKKEIEV